MSKIFLNYRREDSASHAGRLYDDLIDHFGSDSVFIDIDRIDLGVDFIEAINEKIGLCEVLLVLIGKQWLTISDSTGRRLDNPNDFVRLEIVAAGKRNIRIIPLLVDGASMPRVEQLPDPLKFLAQRAWRRHFSSANQNSFSKESPERPSAHGFCTRPFSSQFICRGREGKTATRGISGSNEYAAQPQRRWQRPGAGA